ncbi:uncharacterized protein LOC121400938 [Xenopus laevis]|uniref:Gypsy retrotransposon integrase-like protein 1 n=1 Tax=Xenopus laevis TaxID=8355 RepID=A0A8J1MGY5_XENLA|nr:uncharacterized protein LOC121400938 [Xenopus laevis]
MPLLRPQEVHAWAEAEQVNPRCAFAVDRVPTGCSVKLMHPTLIYHVRLKGIRLVTEMESRVLGYRARLYCGPRELGDDEGPYTVYPVGTYPLGCPVVYAGSATSLPLALEVKTEPLDPATVVSGLDSPGKVEALSSSAGTMLPTLVIAGTKYPKLKVFSGTLPVPEGEQGFEEWQEAAVQMIEECPCPEGDKRIRLTENLRPPASQVVKLFCKAHLKASVRDCLKALEEVYGACDNPHNLLHMFRSLYQEEGELVSTFVRRLQSKLWTLVHKEVISVAEVDEMRRTQLLQGLQASHPIAMELRIMYRQGTPPEMGAIMGVVKEREAELERVSAHSKKVTTGSLPSAQKELEGALRKTQDSSLRPRRASLAKTFSATAQLDCFRCGHQGHRVYQCYPSVGSGEFHSKGGQLPLKRKGKQKGLKPLNLPGVGRRCTFSLLVNGVPTTALFDTGSQLTIIHRPFYLQHLSHLPLQTVGPVPVFGVGTGPTYMDGCVEVQLYIPGLVGDNDPPITVVAYVSPPPGGKGAAPVIVGSNVKAVEEAFLRFLQPREGTPLTVLPVSPELQAICQTFAPESPGGCIGNPWYPVEIPPGGVRNLRVYVEIVSTTPGSYFLLETDPHEAVRNGWEIVPERKDYRRKCPRTDVVTVKNITSYTVTIPAWYTVGHCYPVESVNSCSVPGGKEDIKLNFKLEEADDPMEHRHMLEQKLLLYRDVFSVDEMDVGCAKRAEHSIRLSDDTPFRERSRRIPPRDLEDVRKYLDKMKDQRIIVESRSPYASPIVIVRKKNGSVRLCVDYRTLNRRTVPDQYTLPRIDEALDALHGSAWFSVMDLRSGYYQIPMSRDDQEKTAFICPLGFYEFTRMPQGISGAPATFQRLMEKVLGDLTPRHCIVYLDDIIVFGSTLEEHDTRLFNVLDRLRQEGLKLSVDKCKFARKVVKFVGHIVSAEGIATDPEKVAAVRDWPRPTNLTELRSFLGFCGYYRRFVEGYSRLAHPLNGLLAGSASKQTNSVQPPLKGRWSTDCEEAFLTLKKRLTEAPVLAYADPQKPYVLHVDASYEGLGGILHQEYPEGLKPVAYVSRSLNPAEKNYPVHKLEFLALKWVITDKLHDYLYGVKFEVRTDNNPLTYILTTAKLDAAGHRWLAALSNYQFSLKYKPGPKNVGADALSRRPGLPPCMEEDEWEELPSLSVAAHCATAAMKNGQVAFSELRLVDSLGGKEDCIPSMYAYPTTLGVSQSLQLSNGDMIREQKRDPVVRYVREAVARKDPELMRKTIPKDSRIFLKEWDKLKFIDGSLYRIQLFHDHPERRQLVLPQVYRRMVLRSLHDQHGHLGVEKTFGLIRDRFFWPRMREMVVEYCRRCVPCLQRKSLPTRAAPMEHLKSTGPLDLVCMDFLCIDKDSSGIGNILVVTDHYTRYAQAYPTKDQKAATVAKVLWEKFFVHYGLPNRLHSDQGRDFESRLIKELLDLLNVAKSRTTPYHPEGDALPERFNRTLLDMLGTLSVTEKPFWSRHVSALVHAYNCTRHESTGFSPYFLMFGREARLPIDVQLGVSTDGIGCREHYQYVNRLRNSLKEAYCLAEENAAKVNAGNKRRFDAKVRYRELKPGDKVLLRNLGPSAKHKLADRWRKELFEVVAKLPSVPVYRIQGTDGRVKAWHRNHLLPVPQVPQMTTNSEVEEDDGLVPNDGVREEEVPSTTESGEMLALDEGSDDILQGGELDIDAPPFQPHSPGYLAPDPVGCRGPNPEPLRRGDRVRRPPSLFTYDTVGRPTYGVPGYFGPSPAVMSLIDAHARLVHMMPVCC